MAGGSSLRTTVLPLRPQESPDKPLLLRMKLELPYQRVTGSSNPRSIPINRKGSFSFETELFEGSAMLWVAGLGSSPPDLFKVGTSRAETPPPST